jgi:LysR family transcriptional regulator of gallate degradation
LEEELGVRLFERTSLGAHATREATVLGARVRRAVDHLADAREACCRMHELASRPRAQRIWDFNISNQHIFIFLSLCELHESKRVAGQLRLDVSAVRKAIRAVQAQVGQVLFEKSARGFLIPTEFAEVLARKVKLALAEIRAGLDELTSLGGEIQGEVIIGAAPRARAILLPRIAAQVRRKHPNLTLSMRYDSYAALERGLSYREVDFVIGSEHAIPAAPGVTATALLHDRAEIIVRRDHPLAGLPHPDIAQFMSAEWVLPPAYVPLRRRFSEFLSAQGLPEPTLGFETGDAEIIKGLLVETDYLALMLRCESLREVARGELTFLPCPRQLVEFLRTPVTLHLTHPAQEQRSPSAQAFFDAALRVAAQLQD